MPDNVEAKSKRDTPEKDHSLYPHTGIEGIDRIGLLREQAAKMQTPKSDSGLPSISLHSDHPSDLKTAAGDSTGNQKAGKTYEFDHLDNRAANHHSADAVAYLSKNFDSSKPINLLVYYHGYGSNAESATRDNNLKQQLEKAPPNTMLLVPEWQQNPGARSGAQGHFSETGRFDKMLQEVLDKTPELRGKTLKDISRIDIVAHSAGYNPAQTELYKNASADKVKSLTLLDALYNKQGFDPWLQKNIHALASGDKQFTNIFSGTSEASKEQANRVKGMLNAAGLSQQSMIEDLNHSKTSLAPSLMADHSIVYKYSNATTGRDGAHMSMPKLNVESIEAEIAARTARTSATKMDWQPPVKQLDKPKESQDGNLPEGERVIRSAADLKTFYAHQDDGKSCSAFSIAMLASDQALGRPVQYGKETENFKRLAGTTNHGYRGDLNSIATKLHSIGLEAKAYDYGMGHVGEQTIKDLNKELDLGHSAVAKVINPHTGHPHYIYVAGRDKDGKYIIGDPDRKNAKHFKPVAENHLLQMMKGRDGFVAGWSHSPTAAARREGSAAYRFAELTNNSRAVT